jgi:two-component system response regulator MprA
MRILVIDDDPAIRDSLRMSLSYEGYDVVSAATGWEGLAFVERQVPDLVLLDVEMPGLDGFDVLIGLSARHRALPVVMMSARSATAIRTGAIASGAIDCLEKPFENIELLRATILKAIEWGRLPDTDADGQIATRPNGSPAV